MMYRTASYAEGTWDTFWFEKNLQGDVIAVYDNSGTQLIKYIYGSAWGDHSTNYPNGGSTSPAQYNPFRYRGYYYDNDLGLYYLQSRYYDPNTCRFINADGYISTGQGLTGYNMYAYCGNNPVNRIDPTGNAWYHWALGAAIVVACAAATVITCGGFAAAATAVSMVGSGVAAATTASTIAASAFIGSATVYGSAVLIAASTSHSIDEFNDEGNWRTVVSTAFGGLVGGAYGYDMARTQLPQSTHQTVNSGTSRPSPTSSPNSRYLQYDQSTGQIRSDTVYDTNGNWYSRIDYMHPHNIGGMDYMPHIHISAPLNQYGQPIGRGMVLPW